MAEIAHLSPHHWHRTYHAMYGETLAATVKRLRLHRAAGWLANSSLPVEQVARRSGYPNLQSFTRVFEGAYGLPPARYRARGQHAAFAAPAAHADPGPARPVAIVHLPAIEVIGCPHIGSCMQIGRAFDALLLRLKALGLAGHGTRLLGTYLDDPSRVPEPQLRAWACASGCAPSNGRGDVLAPLARQGTPAAECAVLVHTGPYASMHAAYQWLYGTWLPRSGREPSDLAPVERYLNDPRDTAPADLLTHICLPLRAP